MTRWATFEGFLDDVVGAFRTVAIDDPIDAGDLAVNDHITGPVDADNLAAQYAFPVVWSVPESHTPSYQTVRSDQGQVRMRVVCFAQDVDPDAAFQEAKGLGATIVDAVEDNRSLVVDGDAHAEGTWLDRFDMDFRVTAGNDRAQVKYAQMLFDIDVKRPT